MKLPLFELEEYLSPREFAANYMLCGSDMQSYHLPELLKLATHSSLTLWENLYLGYTQAKGLDALREEIAKLYPSFTAENILCFAGAEEGIFCAFNTLLDKQDHAIVITPCYQSLQAIPSSRCHVSTVELRFENQWQLDLNQVEHAIQSNTKMIIFNFPHNPTGTTISKETLQGLINLAKTRHIWLFADEVYRGLEFDCNTLPAVAPLYEKCISLGVMSKAYGLPGLRIGWVACQNKAVLQNISEMKHYLSIANSAPSEVLALIALQASPVILERNHAIIRENLSLLEQFFQQYAKWFSWIKPVAGCLAFPQFKATLSTPQLAEQLLQEEGVLILPGDVFQHPGNHIRLGFGRTNFPQAMDRFGYFIDKHQHQWQLS